MLMSELKIAEFPPWLGNVNSEPTAASREIVIGKIGDFPLMILDSLLYKLK